MATRRLARTVVEGGRTGGSKNGRREIARANRRWKLDADGEFEPPIARDGYGREFADRLRALDRWLRSRLGRPWADVYAEFVRENNPRTMKGWHLKSHLASEVSGAGFRETGGEYRYLRGFYVEGGILRERRPERVNYRARYKEEADANAWAAGRKVMETDGVLYWAKRGETLERQGPKHRWRNDPLEPLVVWKQSGRMSRADEAVWYGFGIWTRAGLSFFENE